VLDHSRADNHSMLMEVSVAFYAILVFVGFPHKMVRHLLEITILILAFYLIYYLIFVYLNYRKIIKQISIIGQRK
jgi:hypothetical protein